MNTQEFSSEFDILYNNIMSNAAPGLSEYEKSVLLTQSQEALVLDIYNGKFNDDSFESTEEVTSYLGDLVKQVIIKKQSEGPHIVDESVLYTLPEDIWFITYESVKLEDPKLGCLNGIDAIVKPITQDDYYRTFKNPFRGPSDSRVLRLSIEDKSELISKFNISQYLVRYMAKPDPIILEDLTNYGVSINGKTEITECKLNPALHRSILNGAVQLAKAIWTSRV